MENRKLVHTKHYERSTIEVYVNNNRTMVTQVKCQRGDKCNTYEYTFEEYIGYKYEGYKMVKKVMVKTNYIIDIDGTICDDIPNEEPQMMSTARPHQNAIETINGWYDDGHNITFLTSRTDEHREVTEKWMKDNGVNHHGIMFNKPRINNTITEYHYIDNHKIRATRYHEGDSKWGDMVTKKSNVKVFGV